jgi:hypothetical protein
VGGNTPESESQEATTSPQGSAPHARQSESSLRHPMIALGTWAIENPLSALTGLGLVLYGFLRLIYARFYSPLGVKPEEVGLGYAETLSQSVGLLLYSAIMFFLILLLVCLLLFNVFLVVGFIGLIVSGIRDDWRMVAVPLALVGLFVIYVMLPEAIVRGMFIAGVAVIAIWLIVGGMRNIIGRSAGATLPVARRAIRRTSNPVQQTANRLPR